MAKKFEIIGSALIVTDTISGNTLLDMPSRDAYYNYKELEANSVVRIYDTNGTNSTGIGEVTFLLSECVNESDVSFTESTFQDFVRSSLGFNTAPGGSGACYAEFHLPVIASPIPLALNDDGVTYTKIPLMEAGLVKGFSVAGGTLTKTDGNVISRVIGVSDVQVNKATGIFYALFINGSEVPGEVTPHTFTNQSKIENISITAIAQINETDTIDIRARTNGSAMGVTITVAKLDVTFGKEDDA